EGVCEHDLGDGLVGEERLERPVAEDVVRDLLLDADALDAAERCAVEGELLRDHVQDPLRQLLRRFDRVEGCAELRDAGPVHAALELGVRIHRDGQRLVDRRPVRITLPVAPRQRAEDGRLGPVVAPAGDPFVQVHRASPGRRRRRSRAGSPAGRAKEPSSRPTSEPTSVFTPFANRLRDSYSTAGTPELMLAGTEASSGRTKRTSRPIVSAISETDAPPGMPARLATRATRSSGKPSSSRVCSARRMFFIDGTSGVETSRSWSLRSSAVSIGPSKSGAVATTRGAYMLRAVWRTAAILAASMLSPTSGRSGAGRMWRPLECLST